MNEYLEGSRNKIEIYIGGALASIAIIAIIAKMILLGISLENVLDMIMNVSGLAVSALVMFVAIRSIISNSPKNLKQELEYAFKNWEEANRPLVFKVLDFEETEKFKIRFSILAKQTDFLKLPPKLSQDLETRLVTKNSKLSGKFVSLPSFDEMLTNDFVLQYHFIDSSYSKDIKQLVENTVQCVSMRFPDVKPSQRGSCDFDAEFKKISSKDDVRKLIEFINFVLTLLLIQA